jgi:hypothetical protein
VDCDQFGSQVREPPRRPRRGASSSLS